MNGTNASTGKSLTGISHLRQSISDILRTPIGSRVARRSYGSKLFELIDAPMNASTRLALIAAAADALNTWETRIRVDTITLTEAVSGRVVFEITGEYLPDGSAITFDGIEVS